MSPFEQVFCYFAVSEGWLLVVIRVFVFQIVAKTPSLVCLMLIIKLVSHTRKLIHALVVTFIKVW